MRRTDRVETNAQRSQCIVATVGDAQISKISQIWEGGDDGFVQRALHFQRELDESRCCREQADHGLCPMPCLMSQLGFVWIVDHAEHKLLDMGIVGSWHAVEKALQRLEVGEFDELEGCQTKLLLDGAT